MRRSMYYNPRPDGSFHGLISMAQEKVLVSLARSLGWRGRIGASMPVEARQAALENLWRWLPMRCRAAVDMTD